MKPFLEKVPPSGEASWPMLNRRLEDGIPFQWHHHPEYELTLTLNSRGQRFIGDHIGSYGDGDLVLIGPNLPHSWSSTGKLDQGRPHVALVMWFRAEWAAALCSAFVEMRGVEAMLRQAGAALKFSDPVAGAVRPLIERLFTEPPGQRLPSLIRVLATLADDRDARPLASRALEPEPAGADRTRIDRVLDHIHLNYATGLTIEALAEVAALSPSGLHRLFRRHTHTTVSDYLMRLKIGEACAMLSGTARPVAHIAEAVGYASLANFNRQFKAIKGTTPRAYRQNFASSR
jgi:AraC-like DNA-binding protein